MVKFVDPPLAIRPTIPLTQLLALSISPIFEPFFVNSSKDSTVLSIIICLSCDSGGTNEELGSCIPMTSIISWLVLAVP